METDKSRSEIIETLREIVCTEKQPAISFHFDFKGKPFYGTITENEFDIMPVIEGRNSVIPVLKGEIIGDDRGVIVVRMRLHVIVIAFIIFLTTLVLWSLIYNPGNGGLIVLPVIYAATIFFYLRESKKCKIRFKSYFE